MQGKGVNKHTYNGRRFKSHWSCMQGKGVNKHTYNGIRFRSHWSCLLASICHKSEQKTPLKSIKFIIMNQING